MGFEIVGTWSIFTCNYKLLLSKHRMLYKPSYDYYIQQNQKKTQFHERAVFLPFCYHCFVLVYPADTYLPMYTAMPDLWALLLNSSSCRLLASLGLQAQPGIEWSNFTQSYEVSSSLSALHFSHPWSLTLNKSLCLSLLIFPCSCACSHMTTLASQTCRWHPKEALFHVQTPFAPQPAQRMPPPAPYLALPGGLCFSWLIPESLFLLLNSTGHTS